MLVDGSYDAFVIDAEAGDDPAQPGTVHLELTILSGAHKGEVVSVTAAGLADDTIDLLGMPATLTVRDGQPTVRIDR